MPDEVDDTLVHRGIAVPPIQAIIADLDGLLIDSEPIWREVEIAVFGSLGIILNDDLCRTTMGMRVDEVVAHWHGLHPWVGLTEDEVSLQIVEGVAAAVEQRGQPLPGLGHFLELVKGSGCRAAIASSSWPQVIDAAVRRLGLAPHFPQTYSAAGLPFGKPHPGVYLEAAAGLGVEPAAYVALEDSPAGVLAAKAAGMRCIAVPDHAMRHRPEFEQADTVLESLEEVTLGMLLGRCSGER
ncbi:MAG: hexitol phosphatase HxpB [Chloroflexota bacterium]